MYDLVVTRTRRSITERVRTEQNIKRYRGNIERASHLGAERQSNLPYSARACVDL